MSSIIIQLHARYGSGTSAPISNKPTLNVVGEPTPTSAVFSLTNYGSGDYIVYASQDPSFATIQYSVIAAQGTNAAFTDLPLIGEWYFRAKKNTDAGILSEVTLIIFEQEQLRSLTISANAGNGQVTITHDCSETEAGVSVVSVKRGTSIGTLTEIATFAPTTAPYVDAIVVNDTLYYYRLDLMPINADYLASQSNIDDATPQAATTTLSTPSGLTFTQIDNTSGTFSWNSVLNAELYVPSLNGTQYTAQAGTSILISGLTVGQSITLAVYATATGFNNSTNASISRTVVDVENIDALTPAEFGVVDVYENPLDGRNYEGFQYPEINYNVLNEVEFNALNTGLVYADYPNGVTKLTPVDDLGVPVAGVFSADDVQKDFVGFKAHLYGAAGDYVDEYCPYSLGSPYSKVIWQNGDICLVDFAYNGGSYDVNPITNGRGIIFKNNSVGLNAMFDAWKLPTTPENIVFEKLERTGRILKTYYAPQLKQIDTTGVAKNMYMYSLDGSPFRIHYGVEEYYHLQLSEGTLKYIQPTILFKFTGFANKVVSYNGQIIPPRYSFTSSEPFLRVLSTGTLAGGAVFYTIGSKSLAVYNELTNGYGNRDEKFEIQVGSINNSGSYAGEGVLYDVDKFAFDAHEDFDFSGAFAMGQSGGGTSGAFMRALINGTLDFDPQEKWAPSSHTFQARLTQDFTNIGGTGDSDPASKSYLPSRCFEILNNTGNWLQVRVMGGNNRTDIIHFGKFVGLGNVKRYNQFDQYYNLLYNNNETPLITNVDGKNTITASKMIVDWEIVTEKEADGVTPKLITISRDYLSKSSDYDLSGYWNGAHRPIYMSEIGLPLRNAIRTHPNMVTALGKHTKEFTASDFTWISRIDRKPKEWQVDDQFKICAWVELSDITGLGVGDTITSNDGGTGVIRDIDTAPFLNRITIGSANKSFHTATTANGKTITDASDYDPTIVYTCFRKQRGDYPSTDKYQTIKLADTTGFVYNATLKQTYSGSVSGATGEVVSFTSPHLVVKLTNYLPDSSQIAASFIAEDIVSITANGTGSSAILFDENICKISGDPWQYSAGEYSRGVNFGDNDGTTGEARQGYLYSYIMISPNLPYRINGVDDVNPLFNIEVVHSEVEATMPNILSGEPFDVRHTYLGVPKFANNSTNINNVTAKRLESGAGFICGYGKPFAEYITNNPIMTFDSESWLSIGDPYGNLSYTVEATTYFLKGLRKGRNLNPSTMRPANKSNVDNTLLGGNSKGYTVIDCEGIDRLDEVEKASSSSQFERQRIIMEANPTYVPQYAIDEELLPPNETAPYRAKVRLYGANSIALFNSPSEYEFDGTSNVDPTGTNVVRDESLLNAPQEPKTLRDLKALMISKTTI